MSTLTIAANDIIDSIADALQFVSHHHPVDFIEALKRAYARETKAPARAALQQLLINSRQSAFAQRPVCQDTGVAHVYFRVGMDVRISAPDEPCTPSFQTMANRATARAYCFPQNKLRASMIEDPLGARRDTHDNTPAVVHVELVEGQTFEVTVAAKGGGGDVKARYAMLNPSDSIADWVISQIPTMGAGWCPPGAIGIGVGGSPEQAMFLAKRAVLNPIDIEELIARDPSNPTEALRLELYERINELGIGAQGLGGDTTVLDVKVESLPSHAALKPVAILPNCAATRFIKFTLDGKGPAQFEPTPMSVWDDIPDTLPNTGGRRVSLDGITKEEIATWQAGDTLLVSGRILTARDAAHKRMADTLARNEPLPVDLTGRTLFYVGPVDPVGDEVVGPAGPTTSTRMDKFMPQLMGECGLLVTIGKAERTPIAMDAIKAAGGAYLMTTGGAAYLVSKSIRSAKLLAYEDLGMEAIYEFEVVDMPVVVAVDASGTTVYRHFHLVEA
ncbi:fumarate hydratase [Orrella sp. 11846]|uniref:fumarate hydratase n=1 Tax=Orrella sp. 11846 TaxID=3409913 RepID=UPI003B5BE830